MSWKFVFYPNLMAGTSFEDSYEMCSRTYYKFFCFNGSVYFMGHDKAESTGIRVDDLF